MLNATAGANSVLRSVTTLSQADDAVIVLKEMVTRYMNWFNAPHNEATRLLTSEEVRRSASSADNKTCVDLAEVMPGQAALYLYDMDNGDEPNLSNVLLDISDNLVGLDDPNQMTNCEVILDKMHRWLGRPELFTKEEMEQVLLHHAVLFVPFFKRVLKLEGQGYAEANFEFFVKRLINFTGVSPKLHKVRFI